MDITCTLYPEAEMVGRLLLCIASSVDLGDDAERHVHSPVQPRRRQVRYIL